ncbi:MAG: RHS repeat-associated core domain-containing protein, partial [Bacteroidales bacterium]|nr:RHS repeat-associated core domain-containing protein [Bacteroidales bacterium]
SGFLERDGFYTGKKIDRDTGLYYFNARWYDAELGRFITEDPIKDGINWYGYANQNPMTFIDPTGYSSEHYNSQNYDFSTGEELDSTPTSKKEREVKKNFKYMKDYELTNREIQDYFELTMIQKNINAIQEALDALDPQSHEELQEALVFLQASNEQLQNLRNQYDDKLMESMHLQTDPDMIPDGSAGACTYRSYQMGVEWILKSPMPISMINESTTSLTNNGLSMTTPEGENPGSEYYVDEGRSIVNDALQKLGRSDLTSGYGYRANAIGGFTKNKGISVTGYRFHHNLSDGNGNFVADPMTRDVNHNNSTVGTVDISIYPQ